MVAGSDGMVVTVMIHNTLEAKSDFYILEQLNTGIIKSGGGKTRTHEFLIVFGIHYLVKWNAKWHRPGNIQQRQNCQNIFEGIIPGLWNHIRFRIHRL